MMDPNETLRLMLGLSAQIIKMWNNGDFIGADREIKDVNALDR